MKYTICVALLCMAGTHSLLADESKRNESEKAALHQEMLAKKECKTGTPVLKEVRKTVPKTVAGRMIPTAALKTVAVCR